jgi:hypothetical protein
MPVLSFSMGTSIPETYNWVGTAQVFSSLPAAANVVVQLSSDKPDRLQVQDFVTIPAGQTSARFGLAILDNNRIDGDELVTLNATVPGWISAQGQITVRDNEGTNLTLSLPTTAHEGSGVISNVGIVKISAPLPTDLTVNLSSSATDKLQVPASVIISTGQTEALFDVKLPDDDIAATNHVVVVNATAVGFKPAARNVNVRDNDASSFLVGGPGGAAQLVGEPFAMTVQALNASGNVIPGYSGSLNLQAIGLMGSVSVTSSIVGPLTNGQWSGFATVTDVSSSVVLTVNDGLGHTGSSAPFDVITGFVVNLPVSDFVYDPLRQKIQAAENTPPSFRR